MVSTRAVSRGGRGLTQRFVRLLLLLGVAQAGCAGVARPAPTPQAQAQVYLDQGQALIARGEMAAAVSALREALRREPDLIQARTSLGLALYGLGDLDAAVEELRATLRRQPDALTARLTLAAALVAKQDWAAARVELEHVLSAQPDLGQAHYSLGVVRYARGDFDGAIEEFRRVLAGDPHHQDARYNLALMLRLAQRDGGSRDRRAGVSGLPGGALARLSRPRGERRRHGRRRLAPEGARQGGGARAHPRGLGAERPGRAAARAALRAGRRGATTRARRADPRLLRPRGRRRSALARSLGVPRFSEAPCLPR